jgi:arginase
MTTRLRIIGAASGLGAQDRGCADGPVAFHRSQAWHELARLPRVDWGCTLFPPELPGRGPVERIARLCHDLADEVARASAEGCFPLVLGGDHSVAIGTWSGAARAAGGPLGMLWIDAHLDSHTPETSYSGALHGMPLACLLGRGDKRLLGMGIPGAQLDPRHVAVIGPRSFEPEESELLARLGVTVFSAEMLVERGFADCMAQAVAIVAGAPHGFGISLDLDAFDPETVPGVGSPEPDGIPVRELLAGLQEMVERPQLRACEIVEYNPDRDHHGVTARLIAGLIGAFAPAAPGDAKYP